MAGIVQVMLLLLLLMQMLRMVGIVQQIIVLQILMLQLVLVVVGRTWYLGLVLMMIVVRLALAFVMAWLELGLRNPGEVIWFEMSLGRTTG